MRKKKRGKGGRGEEKVGREGRKRVSQRQRRIEEIGRRGWGQERNWKLREQKMASDTARAAMEMVE
jgi:hypothetical protein